MVVRVHIGVDRALLDQTLQALEIAGCDDLDSSGGSPSDHRLHVLRHNVAIHLSRRIAGTPARSRPSGVIAEVRAQEHHDAAVVAGIGDVQMRLQDVAPLGRDVVTQLERDPIPLGGRREAAGPIRDDRRVLVAAEKSLGPLLIRRVRAAERGQEGGRQHQYHCKSPHGGPPLCRIPLPCRLRRAWDRRAPGRTRPQPPL